MTSTSPEVLNLKSKFDQFNDLWSPKVIADLDDYHVKLAKIEGDFVWHSHGDEDELFLVISGSMRMDFRDRHVLMNKGDMIVVPKGVEHKPFAEDVCEILLIEKTSTDHTGGVDDPRRQETVKRI